MLQTLLHKGPSPLSVGVGQGSPQLQQGQRLVVGHGDLSRRRLHSLTAGNQDLRALAVWAVVTLRCGGPAGALRQRFGRGDSAAPATAPHHRRSHRRRRLVCADLAVWLSGKLLAASAPTPPIGRAAAENHEENS